MRYGLPTFGLIALVLAILSIARTQPVIQSAAPPASPPLSAYDKEVGGVGLVEPRTENISISLPVPGLVTHVHVRAGDQVESSVTVGAVLTGTVERVENFGAFVRLGPGQTGLVPNAELGTQRGTDYRKAFVAGTELKVLVLAIEEGGRRIRLSHTQALAREERAEAQEYLHDSSAKSGGFGLTLGELFRQARRT